jgi:trimethylamine:corrinoid methyltransferase-like protein
MMPEAHKLPQCREKPRHDIGGCSGWPYDLDLARSACENAVEETMRTGRALLVSAVLALGATGPVMAAPVLAATAAQAPAAQVLAAAPSGTGHIFYHM